MKRLLLVLLPISLFVFSCEDEVVGDTNNEEVYEVDRLYGLWFQDTSIVTYDYDDPIMVFNDITLEEWGSYWVSYSENEKKSYGKYSGDCYNLVTRSITWEKIDDKNFKNVELKDDGSTIEYYFNFKNDYDGMNVHSSNSLDYTLRPHFTKIENRTFEPLCP
jgi:hypothetical protein